jgi:hypothetical protein
MMLSAFLFHRIISDNFYVTLRTKAVNGSIGGYFSLIRQTSNTLISVLQEKTQCLHTQE